MTEQLDFLSPKAAVVNEPPFDPLNWRDDRWESFIRRRFEEHKQAERERMAWNSTSSRRPKTLPS